MRNRIFLPCALLAALLPGLAGAEPVTIRAADNEMTAAFGNVPKPVPLNEMITLQLTLSHSGAPVEAKSVEITGQRLYSKNGLPTAPSISATGQPGGWRIEGLRFHISGPWRLTLRITSATGVSEIVLPLEVK
ncbi:MAG: hypothetical protein FJX29_04645 [Alphaproteobacteria bacterium]|nr:hypothetical protein [Alphaproteobacteria bacterium]